jgi:transposase
MHVSPMAILRFQVISAYLAGDPPRGQRGAKCAQLADKTWLLPDGSLRTFSAETIRSWVRRYRDGGLAALEDKPRAQRGTVALTDQQIELFCELKREVPERSLGRLIRIAEELELVPKGVVRHRTLHRALHQRGLSGRPKPDATVTDLDRWEAGFPNEPAPRAGCLYTRLPALTPRGSFVLPVPTALACL